MRRGGQLYRRRQHPASGNWPEIKSQPSNNFISALVTPSLWGLPIRLKLLMLFLVRPTNPTGQAGQAG